MSASGDIVDERMLSPDDVQDGIAQGKFELKQEEGEPPKKKLKKALKEEEKISEHGEIWASAALITKGFRITKIATQWNTIHDHVHQILSFESQDSKSVPSDLDYMLKQPQFENTFDKFGGKQVFTRENYEFGQSAPISGVFPDRYSFIKF